VGNKFLQVDAGTSAGMPIAAGATIPSREPIEVAELITRVNDTLKNANEAVTDVRAGINDTVKTVLGLSGETTQVIGDVSRQLERFATTANSVGDDVRGMITGIRNGQGTIGQLMTDRQLYEELRGMANDGGNMIQNLKATSEDLRTISTDLRNRDLGTKVEQVTTNVRNLTDEAVSAIRKLQASQGASAGLMTEVRQTLTSANETMANFADSSEALKRNFFFRGFFKDRGYYDLDEVTVREYQQGQFLRDRQKVMEWLESSDVFELSPAGKEQLSEEGRRQLDLAMAGFLKYSKTDPLVIESWAGPGNEPERVLRSRERGIMVSEYLMGKFELKPNYVAVMPMNATIVPQPQARDGVNLVLHVPRASKR
jgi:phospholipid/cholesterol/gamma-HCH transport system substrate-binding protein